ncbi:cohesin domain-containing protein [Aureliella helgolandensis]|uniref:Serine-aspartate repeat-containing protein C n=1 Tax=Aureliella helgolandensis TaxID=2527968 RepID=A0A518G3K8_9BACT|nr:cohesin domain-containing protein [Aureliella helgolandensis]QDV23129.1 Serine-aspartate repeat-containing protein C precursor [Aureliella helgolandensis]
MLRNKFRPTLENLEIRRLLAAVDIPSDLSGNVAAIVAAPVNIDTAAGIRGAEIRLAYDTSLLDLDSNSVSLGSVWSGSSDAQITANVDDASGTVVIFIASSSPLSATAGSLVNLDFTISSTATVGSNAILNLTSVSLNEGAIAVSPAPAAGADSTDGQILVTSDSTGGDDSISGFVFADANRDNLLSSGEAIPGVTITLTNSSGVQQQAVTDGNGRYEFLNLAPGNYSLQEEQPAAFVDGGSNTLNVALAAASDLTNQNFVEGGLLPQYLYTRLRATVVQPVGSAAWQAQIEQIREDAELGSGASSSSNRVQTQSIQSASIQSALDPSSQLSVAGSRPRLASSFLAYLGNTQALPAAEGEMAGNSQALSPAVSIPPAAQRASVPMVESSELRTHNRRLASFDQALLALLE